MAERSIVWVKGELISDSLGLGGGSASPGKKATGAGGDFEANRSKFSWVRCYLVAGAVTDAEISIEVTDPAEEFKAGQKATIKSKPDAVLMGNDYKTPPSDLITLTHLHEASVVFSLQKRYEHDIIYTATGPILLALNPFKALPGIYDETIMTKYWRVGEGVDTASLDPHVFANADKAFRQMIMGIEFNIGSPSVPAKADQSVLVSGESGAGKTVTTKHIMKYLASLSERKAEHDKRRRAPSPGREENSAPRRSTQRVSRAQSWRTGAQIEEKSK
jgi:myosin heavy subunit